MVQRAANFDRSVKDVNVNESGGKKDRGNLMLKEMLKKTKECAEIEVPEEGIQSKGVLVSLCGSKS